MPLRRSRGGPGAALVVLLGLLGSLGACTGDPGSGGGRTEVGEVVEGGVLRLGVVGPPVLDPVRANPASPTDLLVLDLLHDGLTQVDEAGETTPGLARDWSVDAAGTTWTFELAPDATFSDGRPVTGATVVASLERLAAAGDASLAALRLEPVGGFRDYVEGRSEHLAGLSAEADEVRLVLDHPVAALPQILAGPEMGIVDGAALAAAELDAAARSALPLSGDWVVRGADEAVLDLARRDGAPGHLDGVEVRSFEALGPAYEAVGDGAVDWSIVPPESYGDALARYGDDLFAPFHAELLFGLRVTSGPLTRPELRQAIVAAVDSEEIVAAVYAESADALAAVVPAGVPGHEAGACHACGADIDRARTLVAAAYPHGAVPVVHIDFDESEAQSAMARIVAGQLERAGIPSELRPRPLPDYQRFVISGGQEMFTFGWIGGHVSPEAYLGPLFASGSDDNLTGLADVGVDAAIGAARAGGPGAEAAWHQAEQLALAAAVVVPVAQFRTQAVAADRVQGLAHRVDGTVDWSAVWLAR